MNITLPGDDGHLLLSQLWEGDFTLKGVGTDSAQNLAAQVAQRHGGTADTKHANWVIPRHRGLALFEELDKCRERVMPRGGIQETLNPSSDEERTDAADVIQVLRAAEAEGCSFYVSAPALGGVKTVSLTPEQVLRLISDKRAVFAQVMGLTVAEYIEWYESQGSVYCSAQTQQGRQCRNSILGGIGLEPEQWKSLRKVGGYCSTHGS